MAITTKLELRQTHNLVMTPQLQQAIKLLQLSNVELATFVETELERNPLLEEFHITRLRTSPSMRLSGGERRRVEIARSLATRPSFMLLDEPFAGIDPIAVNDIRALVRHLTQRGIGVLITDHNVRETLDLVSRAYIIHDGMVLTHGTAHEIINNEDVQIGRAHV